MNSTRTIRVLLVDEHELVRKSLTLMIEGMAGLEVVGEAPNGKVAIDMTGDLMPDVILMDINMPVMDGLTATRLIRQQHPQIKVIVLTASILEADTLTASEVGASAYLRKDASTAEIESAIRGAAPQ
jgi:DNA-binding NarL/FixJ family response regulator